MFWWGYVLWGLFGGVLVEALDLAAAVRQRGDWPWSLKRVRVGPYLTMLVVRILIGGGLALGMGQSGQVATPIAAIAVGISAPVIVARIAATSNGQQGG